MYLAEDAQLRRQVALKILPGDLASNQDRMRRFIQEAQTAAALNHPNIAHIYEIGEADSVNFIAMEFIDGLTLRELIHNKQTELSKLLRYLQYAAEGLAKAHAAGIVHRDLKPDNIMITRDGYAKILDFGLAKLIEPQARVPEASDGSSEVATAIMQHSMPGMILGTLGYMSPEQARGQIDQIDQRSDILSFGCILFEAVTRHKAFDGLDVIEILNRIIREPAPPIRNFNPTAPSDLQRIIRRCLAKDPDERYQTIKDLAIELKELRRELAGSADIDTTVPPPPRSKATEEGLTPTPGQDAAMGVPTVSLSNHQSSAEYIVSGIKRHKTVALIPMLLIACVGLAYAVYRFAFQANLRVAHFQKMKITRVTTEGNVESATVSPDGKYIAYSLEESGRRSLWTKHLGTGSRVQIVPTSEACLTLTTDGNALIAVQSDPVSNIWTTPAADASNARPLTPSKNVLEGQRGLAWTPDGRVLYDSNINGKASIWIAPAGGGEPQPLTDSSEEDSAPEASLDGRYIIFGSLRGGGNQI